MTRKIQKVTLSSSSSDQSVKIPNGRILFVSPIEPSLFILCNPEEEEKSRKFRIIHTGHEFDEASFKCDYIGSFEMKNGMAFHIVEIID